MPARAGIPRRRHDDRFHRARAPAPRRRHARAELINAAIAAAMEGQARRRAAARVLKSIPSGWRNTVMPPEEIGFACDGEEIALAYRRRRDGAVQVRGRRGRAARAPLRQRGGQGGPRHRRPAARIPGAGRRRPLVPPWRRRRPGAPRTAAISRRRGPGPLGRPQGAHAGCHPFARGQRPARRWPRARSWLSSRR